MNKITKWLSEWFWFILLILAVVLAIGGIVLWIYALVAYGNTPVSEMPVWVWWLLQNKGG